MKDNDRTLAYYILPHAYGVLNFYVANYSDPKEKRLQLVQLGGSNLIELTLPLVDAFIEQLTKFKNANS